MMDDQKFMSNCKETCQEPAKVDATLARLALADKEKAKLILLDLSLMMSRRAIR